MITFKIIVISIIRFIGTPNEPFNMGHNFDIAPIGPLLVNWPIANSMYSSGMPQKSIIRKYGTRKLPERRKKLGFKC